MRRSVATLCLSIPLLSLEISALHASEEYRLRGEYAFTSNQACIRSNFEPAPGVDGFDRNALPQIILATEAELLLTFVEGTVGFDGEGGITFIGASKNQFVGRTQPGDEPVSLGNQFTCDGNYEIEDRVNFSFSTTCVGESTIGVPLEINPLNGKGRIARGAQQLSIYDIESNIETLTVSPPDGDMVAERVCLTNTTAFKLSRN